MKGMHSEVMGIHREAPPTRDFPGPDGPDPRATAGRYRGLLLLGLAALLLVAKGGDALDCFSPPKDLAGFCERDLSQDWLSAIAVLADRPAYGPLRSLVEIRYGPDALPADAEILPYNAHPPGTVLLTLPLGLLGFRAAWILWTALSVFSLL